MPSKTRDPDLIAVIRQTTDRYITTQKGTPVHAAKTQLGNKRLLLEEAVRDKYLLDIGSEYFPRFRALEFEDSESRRSLEHCASVVLKALRAIYERDGDRMCDHGLVAAMCNTIDPDISSQCVSVGMLFATDFSQYVHIWNASPGGPDLGLNLPASDRLLDFTDLTSAWKQELENRTKMAAPPSRSHKDETPVRPQQGTYDGWEKIEPKIGEGGQSDVYLVRSPDRKTQREGYLEQIAKLSGRGYTSKEAAALAEGAWGYCRPDNPSELGALKIFKIRNGGAPAAERLRREIAVLREGRFNLPKLLASNEADQWIITEYFPHGTLENSPLKYRADPVSALRAFRGLVETVAISLHTDKIVHRDIKPANVFIGDDDGRLIPGDFGIVFLPNQETRPTVLGERVGPWEYMPPWADGLAGGLEKVQPNFDVYMLGKLLWCMVAGRLRLRREDHREPEFDLAKTFPDNRYMQLVNSILDRCLVRRPQECLPSAHELLEIVDANLAMMEQGVPLVNEKGKLALPCRICGRGFYQDQGVEVRVQQYDAMKNVGLNGLMHLRVFVCNVCTHRAFFAPNYPDESSQRSWKDWTPRQ